MNAVLDLARGAVARRARKPRTSPFPYALLAPIVVFECLFVIYPIVRGILLSFHETNFGVTKFVGLAQYRQMLHDPIFWSSVQTTFEFTFAMIAVWLSLGLAVALLMNWSFAGRGFVRAILAIPWAVPDIPVVLTFTIMLDPNFGILNRFAAFIPGVHHQIQWLSAPNLAFIAIIIMVGWKGFPFFSLILLSSLQSIPDELYEAAKVDGAGPVRRFRSITLPALYPTLGLLGVLAFIFSFQQFSLIYLSTGGGPGTDTSTLAVTIYNQAFEFFNYNYASAVAVVGLLLAAAGTVLYIVLQRRVARARRLEGVNAAL
ncbi:MAG TPA: sugar ABC transporter permease [Streptosporangiaceae bacterium]|nr:sugar ABC transporter permease [Streptosporangiaceae bacterium]